MGRMYARRYVLGVLIGLLVLVAGCIPEREQVMVPPRADLQGAKSIAVLYFNNYTVDPGLALELEQGIANHLRGYYRIVDRATVEATLQSKGLRRDSVLTQEMIRELGDALEVDAIITGEVTYYFEDVTVKTPQISGIYADGTKARWTTGQVTSVLVNMNARVTSTKNAVVLYSKRVAGSFNSTDAVVLSWDSLQPPPDSIMPRPSRKDIPRGRLRAIQDAVESFTVDLLPTYVWRRVE